MNGLILKTSIDKGMNKKQQAGKVLYAVLFLLVIPLLQWYWARSLDDVVCFKAIQSTTAGSIIAAAGFFLIAWGMFALKKFGKGLPMNAYPPEFFVKKGPYAFLRHPIYWGYGILMTGVFIIKGSASGLWIVTPISILAMIALVMGYEKLDLEHRFKGADMSVKLDLPSVNNSLLTSTQRIASFFWVFIFLLASNYVVWFLLKDSKPVWEDSLAINFLQQLGGSQLLAIPFTLLAPLLLKDRNLLSQWSISSLAGIGLSFYIALLWPEVAAQYFYNGDNNLLILLSVPVFLTMISALAFGKQFPQAKIIIYLFAILLMILQLSFTKAFYLNLVVSVFIFLLADNYELIWLFIRNTTERVANSWQEWEIGPIRIINRGFYVGIAGFAGILFCGLLVGKEYAWMVLLFAVVTTVSAAIWAQVIEGSEKLKRPFGFYGAIVGIIFASLLVWLLGFNAWVLIGVISVIMPWVQGVGRFGCLINGCCHGKPTENANIGIRYFHFRSRVCNVSGLKGKYLHPTQVYSMLWLLFVGFLLLVLWLNDLSYSFIFGMYLILTGIGRFVEEAYRGEVQTPYWNTLRLYQWVAIATVLAGIFFTLLKVDRVLLDPDHGWETWIAAFAGGLFIFFAMGVDFPRSNARFSRLV